MKPLEGIPDDQADTLSASTAEEIQATLWKAVDKLRGSVNAAQYKEFVLGLIFLKYVTDVFDERRNELANELAELNLSEDQIGDVLEDRVKYTGAQVFWVPETARWSWIVANARNRDVGELLDEAMDAVMRENAALTGALPRVFNRDYVDQSHLAELVRLIDDVRFGGSGVRPELGEVYEYFLASSARAEGKRGGEFYTPQSVTRLIAEILEPYEGRVYDPACGSGGMLIQASNFIEAHRGRDHRADITVYGQGTNAHTWRLAKMNLAVHGVGGNLGTRWGNTFADDQHPGLKADYVMANPPFNIKTWVPDESDTRWKFGVPPKSNANYAWLQHVVSKLGEQGVAGIILANGSMTSQSSTEGRIRQAIVDADLVACMVALPSQLFRSTQIPACVWLLAEDKSAQGVKRLADRRAQILFIYACDMGQMVSRTERVLTETDIAKIAGTYRAWRGMPSAQTEGLTYEDEPGFCFSAGLDTVREHRYALTPGRYVGVRAQDVHPGQENDMRDGPATLMKDLYATFD
ncbi:class I SAM-dependent DNA methyltransferase [Streptomyces sp. NPDC039016]|uniref:type I restriction-modification system subunit M n=1 Tax=Streptomyces sp. NPDC039016 TaxID=3154330 RepID=UPI0033F5CA09